MKQNTINNLSYLIRCRVLVGAPLANQTAPRGSRSSIHERYGAVYKCRPSKGSKCESIPIDITGEKTIPMLVGSSRYGHAASLGLTKKIVTQVLLKYMSRRNGFLPYTDHPKWWQCWPPRITVSRSRSILCDSHAVGQPVTICWYYVKTLGLPKARMPLIIKGSKTPHAIS